MSMGDMYESPHRLVAGSRWYTYRENYANSPIGEDGDYEREVMMANMLSMVTETNPPVNRINLNPPQPERRQRSTTRMAGLFILTYLSIMILWILIVMAIT